MARYMIRRIREDGREELGTSSTIVVFYKNDRNALRYGHLRLRNAAYPAGQYVVRTFPATSVMGQERLVGHLYKLV